MHNLNIAIVGAGIGGLQAALALAKDGHQITVFESTKEFLEVSVRRCRRILKLSDDRSALAFESHQIHQDYHYHGESTSIQ